MATNEPMTDERLSEIRARVKNAWAIQAVGPANMGDLEPWQLQSIAVAYVDDVADLLDEVERLRTEIYEERLAHDALMADMRVNQRRDQAEIDRLRAREAAARAIAERMAEGVPIGSPAHCYYCNAAYDFEDSPSGVRLLEAPHKPDCPVTKALALSAESEGE